MRIVLCGFGVLRLEHADIGLGAGDLRVGAGERRLGLVERGLRVVELRLRADLGLHQLRWRDRRRARHCRPRPAPTVFCASACCSEACAASVCASMRSSVLLLRGDLRLGLGERDAVVAVVDGDQRIAGLDVLVLDHSDRGDIAGDLRRHERHVGLHIGVVGRDHEAAVGPVLVAVPAAAGEQAERHDRQHEGARRALLLGRRLRRRRGGGRPALPLQGCARRFGRRLVGLGHDLHGRKRTALRTWRRGVGDGRCSAGADMGTLSTRFELNRSVRI